MDNIEKLRLDSATLASLEQILDLGSIAEPKAWRHAATPGDCSPPFSLSSDSPDSPGSPLSPSDTPSGDNEYLIIPSEGGIIHYCNEGEQPDSPKGKKKRGRKPLRPFDPVRKKTEEKDKYWLRAFRSYMKANYVILRAEMSADDRIFWREHLGVEGKPEKGRRYDICSFLSYGKKYKDYLFSHPTFVFHFQRWFTQHGAAELGKKYPQNTDLWFVFYDFASKELLNYVPSDPEQVAVAVPGAVDPNDELFDMDMIDAEDMADSLLSK